MSVITPGKTLRELRLETGISLRAFALRAGVDKALVSQIERGRLIATPAQADMLAAALDLPAGALHTRTLLVYEGAA